MLKVHMTSQCYNGTLICKSYAKHWQYITITLQICCGSQGGFGGHLARLWRAFCAVWSFLITRLSAAMAQGAAMRVRAALANGLRMQDRLMASIFGIHLNLGREAVDIYCINVFSVLNFIFIIVLRWLFLFIWSLHWLLLIIILIMLLIMLRLWTKYQISYILTIVIMILAFNI